MKENQIEILLAAHNGEEYIEEQINSIFNQNHDDIKLLVFDDCSNDNTPKILKEIQSNRPDKISLFWNYKVPVGPIQVYSKLLSLSKAQYLMFCDQDDVWLPKKISKSISAIKSLEKKFGKDTPLLVHTDLEVVDRSLNSLHSSFCKYIGLNPHKANMNNILVQNVVTGSTILINRSLANICTPILSEALMHDWWIAIIAFTKGHVHFIDEATIKYRQHSENVVGARKWSYSPYSIAKKVYKSISSNNIQEVFQRSLSQAKSIQEHLKLSDPDSDTPNLTSFVELSELGWISKRISMIRNGFLKGKLIQNIGLFIQKL